jgi:subfamily B ATP-binding cassette protein MsbA
MPADGRTIYLRLLRNAVPYWRTFASALLAAAVLGLTEPALAALLKPTFDGSFVERDVDTVALMALLIVVLFLVRGVAAYTSAVCLASVSTRVVRDLRQRMLARLVTVPLAHFDDTTSGALTSKITYDATQLAQSVTSVVTVLVRDTIVICGLVALMLYHNWALTLIALATAPVVVLVVKHFSKRLRRISSELQQLMGHMTHVLQEVITGQRVVRSFVAQDYERERFDRVSNRVRQFELKFASAASIISPFAQAITAVGLAAMIYLAAVESAADNMTVGTFASFFGAMGLLFPPLKRLTGINAGLQRGIAAASSVFSLIDEVAETDTGTHEVTRALGAVSFKNVSFHYASTDARAVNGVLLDIKAGETVALVGPSGSGKSTLAALVTRFFDPEQGRVLLDDVDLREYRLANLRRQVALVSQDVVLFEGSVRENIAYGPLSDASEQDIDAAVESASAAEFIARLPQGLDTQVGQHGIRLSGGQRQRLAIARAFLKDAPVLILDEATSALDNQAEREIQQALRRLSAGRTTIIIAHRLSSIVHADRIAVLDAGRVVDTGTHQQLIVRNPLYAGLYRVQFGQQHSSAEDAAGVS